MQGPIANRARLANQPGDAFTQDLSDQTRVDLIATLPSVSLGFASFAHPHHEVSKCIFDPKRLIALELKP